MHNKDQNPEELAWLLGVVRSHGVQRYLEIGARHGHTFRAVMEAMGGGFGVVVDLVGHRKLQEAVAAYNGVLEVGDSTQKRVISRISGLQPFDLILIDGDHRYEYVSKDWKNYGPMGRIVAFHDAHAPDGHMSHGHPVGVPQLWAELKLNHKTDEFHVPGSEMGYGVIFR